MQEKRRVYPAGRGNISRWSSRLMLVLTAMVLFSGLTGNQNRDSFTISPEATTAPIVLDEAFDETAAQREITLPSSTWYALQLGAFEQEDAANAAAEQFVRRGAAGYVWRDGRFRTLAAVYPSREDAQLVRQQLLSDHAVETWLYEVELPAIRLRLSGMKGQLDILEAAFLHANDLVGRQQEISVALDRQELTAQEAAAQLVGLSEQVGIVSLRLRQRFAPPRNKTVESMIECLEQYTSFADEMEKDYSSVALGARLRHQTLSTLHLLQKVYHTLSHT